MLFASMAAISLMFSLMPSVVLADEGSSSNGLFNRIVVVPISEFVKFVSSGDDSSDDNKDGDSSEQSFSQNSDSGSVNQDSGSTNSQSAIGRIFSNIGNFISGIFHSSDSGSDDDSSDVRREDRQIDSDDTDDQRREDRREDRRDDMPDDDQFPDLRGDGTPEDNGGGIGAGDDSISDIISGLTEIEVKIFGTNSKVELKSGDKTIMQFFVDSTDPNTIISEIASITGLTTDKIRMLLDVEREAGMGIANRREDVRITSDTFGGNTEVKVELEFLTDLTGRDEIADEIKDRIDQLDRSMIDSLLRMDDDFEELERRLKIESRPDDGMRRVKFEFRFPLSVSDRGMIVDGTLGALQSLKFDGTIIRE